MRKYVYEVGFFGDFDKTIHWPGRICKTRLGAIITFIKYFRSSHFYRNQGVYLKRNLYDFVSYDFGKQVVSKV